jgi:hypothetical protein
MILPSSAGDMFIDVGAKSGREKSEKFNLPRLSKRLIRAISRSQIGQAPSKNTVSGYDAI